MKITIQLIGDKPPQRYVVDEVKAEGNKLILINGKEKPVEIALDTVAVFWRGRLASLLRPATPILVAPDSKRL